MDTPGKATETEDPSDRFVSLESLKSEYKWFSESLSRSTRVGVISLIGALWAILSASGVEIQEAAYFGLSAKTLGRSVFMLAGVVLMLDFLQYLTAFWMTNSAIDRFEKARDEGEEVQFSYDRQHLGLLGISLYWCNFGLFPLKMLAAFACFVAFILLTLSLEFS